MQSQQFLLNNPTQPQEMVFFLQQQFPQYDIQLVSNQFGHEIKITQSLMLGVLVTFHKNNTLVIVTTFVPSTLAFTLQVLFFLFALFTVFLSKENAGAKMAREVCDMLAAKYG